MTINLHLPDSVILKPCIAVFGVGGAGGNAVNNMISSNLEGVKFVVANTDAQALEYSLSDRRIQLGENITRGLGAGAAPEVGRAAAEESMELILEHLEGSNMVFITAGMGGGTGTGAAPVIAKAAREKGILTVGVVTKPFHFEGSHRMRLAELGLQELQKYVDTLIVIPNQNLFRIANERTTFADAFKMADDVLHAGVRGVTDLMIMPGLINLDFADIRAVMSEMGKAMMGTGEAEGDKRALHAAEAAISNPLLDNVSMKGARGVLINITGGMDMTLFEVDEAANRIRDEVDPDANIIFGSTFNPDLSGRIRVSVVATGIEAPAAAASHDNNSGGGTMSAPAARPTITATLEKRFDHVNPAIITPKQESAPAIAPTVSAPTLSKQFGLEEDLDMGSMKADDDNYFMAPHPVEPRTVIAEAQLEKPAAAIKTEVRHQELKSEEKAPEKEASKSTGLGLFGRMRSRPQEEEVRKNEEDNTGNASRDDILEIPAFLRRKTTTPVS